MRCRVRRFALLLAPVLLLAGCASEFSQRTQVLGDRLQTQLRRDIAAGRVTLEQQPDGARVVLVEPSLYANGGATLDESGRNVVTNVIQALLDPGLMRVEVAGEPQAPWSLQVARAQAVAQYFTDAGLGAVVQPVPAAQAAPPEPPATVSPGVTITVTVVSG